MTAQELLMEEKEIIEKELKMEDKQKNREVLGVNPMGARERSSTSVELHCVPSRKFAFDTKDNVIDQNMLTV